MTFRNRLLRQWYESGLSIARCPADSGIAAMLLEAAPDKVTCEATGISRTEVWRRMRTMARRCGARNRVGLALALQREIIERGERL